MLFNSTEFIFLFLPFVFIVYFILENKFTSFYAKGFLVVSSLFFYGWWNILYLPIIIISILFNYYIGNKLIKKNTTHAQSKTILIIGIISNLLLLGYFKYSDFMIENFNFVFDTNIGLLNLTLPLAISFFTFQQIAYLVDSYKAETQEYDLLNYSVFVTFFPQLIAGPIVHHKEMMPQFSDKKNKQINYNNIAIGLVVFSIGLFKKVAIADTFSEWANAGYESTALLTFFEAWATSLSYSFQLYFDFSGYSDMAIGLALMFNIKLPLNFNSPYKAMTIQDFWRRWHMTLSRFLRDYIYIPLGGSRVSEFKIYLNVMITFIIGGIWHGAGWTFIVWGTLHGLALAVHRFWSTLGLKMWRWLAWFITFNFINVTWVFFRAENWTDAINVLKNMFTGNFEISQKFALLFNYINPFTEYFNEIKGIAWQNNQFSIWTLGMILIGFKLISLKNSNELAADFANSKTVSLYWLLKTVLLLGIALLVINLQSGSEFLYFNF